MSLKDLLVQRNLTTALIVDDGYYVIPRADDLVSDGDAWANFFADLGADSAVIARFFPKFEGTDASLLQRSDEFVAVLWGLREHLRPDLWEPLFERYVRDNEYDRTYLKRLETALQALGVTPIPSAREISDEDRKAPLIFADLFLGSAQADPDIKKSIERLRALLAGRESEPPVVILMSRSSKLSDKRRSFRDGALLLGARFRVHSKDDLLDGTTLERTLERLARHQVDALRVAAFLHAWSIGLEAAKGRFMAAIRRLDLVDYCQIRQLLLDFEGQPLGSYLLDVFDRVLQHEIEADNATIAAAEILNAIDTTQYPPPYVAGSSDLQELVYRSIYQHQHRLLVRATDVGAPVSFGDILARRTSLTPGAKRGGDDVLVVLTPACDLARPGIKRVMLMAGELEDLTPKSWIYKSALVRTQIVVLPDERRMWIRWDLKDIQTMTPADLTAVLGGDGTHQVLVRLRESQALELQQKLLSDLGRVGLVAQMPATFQVSVEAFFVDVDGALQRLTTPTLDREGGVCFTGKDTSSAPVARLVLSEAACDDVLASIRRLDGDVVHGRARATLARLKAASGFAATLEHGVPAPPADRVAFVTLTSPVLDGDGKWTKETVGLIVRNPAKLALDANEVKNGAFVLVMRDL